jgi:hypothetical protein
MNLSSAKVQNRQRKPPEIRQVRGGGWRVFVMARTNHEIVEVRRLSGDRASTYEFLHCCRFYARGSLPVHAEHDATIGRCSTVVRHPSENRSLTVAIPWGSNGTMPIPIRSCKSQNNPASRLHSTWIHRIQRPISFRVSGSRGCC